MEGRDADKTIVKFDANFDHDDDVVTDSRDHVIATILDLIHGPHCSGLSLA